MYVYIYINGIFRWVITIFENLPLSNFEKSNLDMSNFNKDTEG